MAKVVFTKRIMRNGKFIAPYEPFEISDSEVQNAINSGGSLVVETPKQVPATPTMAAGIMMGAPMGSAMVEESVKESEPEVSSSFYDITSVMNAEEAPQTTEVPEVKKPVEEAPKPAAKRAPAKKPAAKKTTAAKGGKMGLGDITKPAAKKATPKK